MYLKGYTLNSFRILLKISFHCTNLDHFTEASMVSSSKLCCLDDDDDQLRLTRGNRKDGEGASSLTAEVPLSDTYWPEPPHNYHRNHHPSHHHRCHHKMVLSENERPMLDGGWEGEITPEWLPIAEGNGWALSLFAISPPSIQLHVNTWGSNFFFQFEQQQKTTEPIYIWIH